MLERMQEQGQTPQALSERPHLLGRLQWHFDCFSELTNDRSYTQGYPLRLSTFQIYTYWKVYDLPDFDSFAHKIKQIDRIWSGLVQEKQDRESKAKEPQKGSRPPPSK